MAGITVTNQTGAQSAKVYPWGAMSVQVEGQAVFSDPFDGSALDTTDRWGAAVVAGAGAVAVSGGLATITVGTGASSAAAISTIEKFCNFGISWLQYATLLQFEAGSAGLLPINVNSFFGQGTPNGSYTASTPLNDAIGFERTIDGKVSCVIYAATVRTLVKDISSYFMAGTPVLVGIASRGDTKYWFVNDLETPVASLTYTSPANINLPIRWHSINHTSGPAVAPTNKITGVQVLDSGNNVVPVFNGNTISRQRAPTVFKSLSAVSVATETTIWTPASGKKFRLMGFVLTSGTVGGNITLKDNTAGTTIMVLPFGGAASTLQSPPMGNGILSAAANNVLTATGVATQTLSGFVFGTEE